MLDVMTEFVQICVYLQYEEQFPNAEEKGFLNKEI